jgi:prolyl-tRNA editing enzyme YbaK/EbsC (Cys-tRNA(Pro) deacylase)
LWGVNVGDLEAYLERHGVWHRFIDKRETVHTADASEATGIDLHRITKNLGAKNVRLEAFERASGISGYPPGGTPSVGHSTPMRVVIDSEVAEMETFYCGGGRTDRLLELRAGDVIRLTDAIVAPISKNG